MQTGQILAQTAAIMGCELGPMQLMGYLDLLRDLESDSIRDACQRWMKESAHMPKPADILRLCGRGAEQLACQAWEEVLSWLERWGCEGKIMGETQFVESPDGVRVERKFQIAPNLPPRTQRALTSLSGSYALSLRRIVGQMNNSEKLSFIQKDFIRAWKDGL